jgi:hypothetical protein
MISAHDLTAHNNHTKAQRLDWLIGRVTKVAMDECAAAGTE